MIGSAKLTDRMGALVVAVTPSDHESAHGAVLGGQDGLDAHRLRRADQAALRARGRPNLPMTASLTDALRDSMTHTQRLHMIRLEPGSAPAGRLAAIFG